MPHGFGVALVPLRLASDDVRLLPSAGVPRLSLIRIHSAIVTNDPAVGFSDLLQIIHQILALSPHQTCPAHIPMSSLPARLEVQEGFLLGLLKFFPFGSNSDLLFSHGFRELQ